MEYDGGEGDGAGQQVDEMVERPRVSGGGWGGEPVKKRTWDDMAVWSVGSLSGKGHGWDMRRSCIYGVQAA